MKIMPPSGSTKGPEQIFTGDVYFDVIVMGEKPSRVRANSVHFAPSAHTAWHSHALGQYLHVTEGVALVLRTRWRNQGPSTRGNHLYRTGCMALAWDAIAKVV